MGAALARRWRTMTLRPMHKRPSSYDVARLAQVSQATVSMVLSGRDSRISQKTREHVLKAAQELGYVVSSAGRALATGRTGRIGFVPSDPKRMIANPYYRGVLSGAIDAAAALECGLLILTGGGSPEAIASEVLGGAVDAVVLLGRHKHDLLTRRLAEAGFPMVCAAYRPDLDGPVVVDIDKEAEGRLAGKKAFDAGHRRAAFCRSPGEASWLDHFRAGLEAQDGLDLVELDAYAPGLHDKMKSAGCSCAIFAEEAAAILAVQGPEPPALLSVLQYGDRHSALLAGVVEPVEEVGSLAVRRAAGLLTDDSAPKLTLLPVSWQDGPSLFGPEAQ